MKVAKDSQSDLREADARGSAVEKIPTRTRTTGVGRFLTDDFGIVIVYLVHDNRNYETSANWVLHNEAAGRAGGAGCGNSRGGGP
jgi:hypothetical protein